MSQKSQKHSILGQVDLLLKKLDEAILTATDDVNVQPQQKVDVEEKKEESSQPNKKQQKQKQQKKPSKQDNTGLPVEFSWALDPNSGRPIDPSTNKPISKKRWKKAQKQKYKLENQSNKEQEKEKEHQRVLNERLKNAIKIKEDPKLEKPQRIYVNSLFINPEKYIDKRIEIHAWVHYFRSQKTRMFLELRDGTGTVPFTVQCMLEGDLINTKDAILMNRETSIMIRGKIVKRTFKEDSKDQRPVEIVADYYEVIGRSSSEIENKVNKNSNIVQRLDQRHWVNRTERGALILRMRCYVTHAFREHFLEKGFIEVTPPTLVQTQVEGGSTLFKIQYFDEEAYMTQSSQLYLETAVPCIGNSFCIMPSYRAEKSHTRRHLAEFTHVEGEMPFITFEDLLDILEDMVVDVCDRVISKHGKLLNKLNPKFIKELKPKKPFIRMTHEDAIEYCNKNGIYKDEETKTKFEKGDDISEMPERAMTDKIGKPIFLIKFPHEIKSFYMARDKNRNDLTESVDLLMPTVGEIIGGSMRTWDYKKLMKGFKDHNIDPTPYYWYTDLRKYGTMPHGGFGLGLERFLCWMLDIYNIRDACLFPRFMGRCKP